MKRKNLLFRVVAIAVLTAFTQWIMLPSLCLAQAGNCDFDPNNPSVEHARTSFKMLNYKCAEEELNAYLARADVGIEDKANAHILMASVYYAMLKNDTEKRDRVTEEFVKAFKAYREWRGELDIKSGEFLDLMENAKERVDTEAAEQPAPTETAPAVIDQPQAEEIKPAVVEEQKQEETKPAIVEEQKKEVEKPAVAAIPEKKAEEKKKKAWYSNWWAIAGGVGLIAVAAVALGGGGGGGGDEGTPDLPGIPDPPSGK